MVELKKLRKRKEKKIMLTDLIEEKKITLIHGESGNGKSVWIVKHLNDKGIIPIIIDFDDNEVEEFESMNIKAELLDGDRFIETMISDSKDKEELVKEIDGKVLVFDTWSLYVDTLKYSVEQSNNEIKIKLKEEYAKLMLDKLTEIGATIIIIAHTKPYSGKEDMPDMDPEIYRHIKGRLHIRKSTLKTKVEYHLIVEKVRGYKGETIIEIRIEEP